MGTIHLGMVKLKGDGQIIPKQLLSILTPNYKGIIENTAVHTDCADLAQRFEDAGLVIGKRVKHQADCLIVIGHRDLIDFLAGIVSLILVCDAGTVHADSLAKALGKKFLRLSVDDLELQ